MITKKYIFHYDTTKAAWCGHTKYMNHDGQECTALIFTEDEISTFTVIHVKFADGFTANVFFYELEEVI